MAKAKTDSTIQPEETLFNELSHLIEQSRQQVLVQANSALNMLFWHIGKRINENILQNKRAEYGKGIVPTLSTQLENKYGRNFTKKNVRRMIKFAEQFQDFEIVVPLSRQLSWSHFVELLPLKSHKAKMFYAQASANLQTIQSANFY